MGYFKAALFPLILLSACRTSLSWSEEHVVKPETYNASIGIVNHTDRLIYTIRIGGGGGGHAPPYHAGVADVCCITLPLKWYAGMKVNVGWDMPNGREHLYKTKVVEVEKYEDPQDVYLHFFPNDEVRVVVTKWTGSSPKHPIPPPEVHESQREKNDQ